MSIYSHRENDMNIIFGSLQIQQHGWMTHTHRNIHREKTDLHESTTIKRLLNVRRMHSIKIVCTSAMFSCSIHLHNIEFRLILVHIQPPSPSTIRSLWQSYPVCFRQFQSFLKAWADIHKHSRSISLREFQRKFQWFQLLCMRLLCSVCTYFSDLSSAKISQN